MPQRNPIDIDSTSPPFDRLSALQRLAPGRSGRASVEHARHHLFVGRHKQSRSQVLVKLTTRPGLIYQHDLANEIATLLTINRELPDSRYFPMVFDHGQLRDGRVYLITSLFDEFPLATTIGTERMPAKAIAYIRAALEVAKALAELHRLPIFHVDLNPLNILYRVEKGRPVIRIVDFESSYEPARRSAGDSYNPPTTPGYSAPEISHQTPDARADVFSLGAVLYTMLAGYEWTWHADAATSIQADRQLDPELQAILRIAVDPDPDKRHPSVQEFQRGLAAHLEQIWPGRTW